jgi:hypothetical protein
VHKQRGASEHYFAGARIEEFERPRLGALDLATGDELKTGRLSDAIDEYFASPVAAGGRILTTSRSCKLTWIEAGADWKVLRVNDLGEECFATPALGEDGVFVRTTSAIYRFAIREPKQD